MSTEIKEYCIVAENRQTGKRSSIWGPHNDFDFVNRTKIFLNKSMKKSHRYFHVAIFPYKQK